jgi:hypothetical protein
MREPKDLRLLGYILYDPKQAFKYISENGIDETSFKDKNQRAVYLIMLEEYAHTGTVTARNTMGKLLIPILDRAFEIKWKMIKNRLDYGGPHSDWPRK